MRPTGFTSQQDNETSDQKQQTNEVSEAPIEHQCSRRVLEHDLRYSLDARPNPLILNRNGNTTRCVVNWRVNKVHTQIERLTVETQDLIVGSDIASARGICQPIDGIEAGFTVR